MNAQTASTHDVESGSEQGAAARAARPGGRRTTTAPDADRTGRRASVQAQGEALESFSAPDTARLVGISYRQLDYWARTELVRPSQQAGQGSGSRRRYAYRDLLELKIVKRMLDAGISLASVRASFDYLRMQMATDAVSANIVISGNDVLLADEEQVISLLRAGQGTMLSVLAVSGVKQELDADVVAMFPAVQGEQLELDISV